MPDVSMCFDFFHSFPRMLDFLSFSFTYSIAAITLGSLAFTSGRWRGRGNEGLTKV